MKCIDKFCFSSGQKVNCLKSKIFSSRHTARSMKSVVTNLTNIPFTDDLGKYLGFFFSDGRSNPNGTYIFKKMRERLSSWKAKIMSFPGRATLIKYVMTYNPSYVMQVMRFPSYICEDMDKINTNFHWQVSEDKMRIHLINWKKSYNLRSFGCLNILKANFMNKAFLIKLAWRLLWDDSSLQAQILKRKYKFNQDSKVFEHFGNIHSTQWTGIKLEINLLNQRLLCRLGNGKRVQFWEDR